MKQRIDLIRVQSFLLVGYGAALFFCGLTAISSGQNGWIAATLGWFAALVGEWEKYSASKFANKVITETNKRNGHE